MKLPNVLHFVGFLGISAFITLTYSPSSRSFAVQKIPILSSIQKFNKLSERRELERQGLNKQQDPNVNENKIKKVSKVVKYTNGVKPKKGDKKLVQIKTIPQQPFQKKASKQSQKHRFNNIEDDSDVTIKVIYRDLSACEPRPEYLPEYRAHCWAECKKDQQCKHPPTLLDVDNSKARMHCFPNLHLIGLRKSGTTDFSTIWITGIEKIERIQQDYYADAELCPVSYMKRMLYTRPKVIGGNIYNGGPGTLTTNTKVYKNETHLLITSGMQYLGYMSTAESRFYLQLRNPTDRVISYLFHWQRGKLIPQYRYYSRSVFTGSFVDTLIQHLIADLNQCIARHGEVACVYMPDSHDGNLEVLLTHSLYVVYIEEMFKFIPKEQVMIKTMEEYSKDRESTAAEVIKQFFGVKTSKSFKGKARGRVINRGQKNPVLPSTIELLDEFFAPYNQRLSELLGDQKFLFIKPRV